MGGAAGHIRHVWEATELTYKDLRDITIDALNGNLKNVSEKLDGQNIMVTFKGGVARSARSVKHLKNYGEHSLDIEGTHLYFEHRGNHPKVEQMFIDVLRDFQQMYDEHQHFNEIFMDGKIWMNIEILCKDNVNVIPYFTNRLVIHQLREIDESGKVTKILKDLSFLPNKQYEKFFIGVANNIRFLDISEDIKKQTMKDFDDLQGLMKDEQTIADLLELNVKSFIKNQINEDEEFVTLLAKRWARGDKQTNITKLLSGKSDYIISWVKKQEEKNDMCDITIDLFIDFFSKLGITVLKHIDGLVSTDPQRSVKDIGDLIDIIVPNEKNQKFFKRYKDIGGKDTIVATEGIVFEYKGDTFKLTGNFTPILRIIGIHKFGS